MQDELLGLFKAVLDSMGSGTDDEGVVRRCQMLHDHGQSKKYFHDIEGYNGRLDATQAGLLRVKLRHLAKWNEQRRDRARGYEEQFAGAAGTIVLPQVPSWSRPVYHLYAVRVADRERVQEDLAAASIGTGIHYPIPVHLLKAYEALGFRPGDFPVAEQVGRGGAVACSHRGPEVAGREVKSQGDAV